MANSNMAKSKTMFEHLMQMCESRTNNLKGDMTTGYVYMGPKRIGRISEDVTIEKVIFNPPATIVLWSDGSKTVVKCQEGDFYDPEKGLAMAIVKKTFGNKGNYCNEIKKWTNTCKIIHEEIIYDPLTPRAYSAYEALLEVHGKSKITKAQMAIAIEEAIGYLGQVLE